MMYYKVFKSKAVTSYPRKGRLTNPRSVVHCPGLELDRVYRIEDNIRNSSTNY